jgi:hypothetical protein
VIPRPNDVPQDGHDPLEGVLPFHRLLSLALDEPRVKTIAL